MRLRSHTRAAGVVVSPDQEEYRVDVRSEPQHDLPPQAEPPPQPSRRNMRGSTSRRRDLPIVEHVLQALLDQHATQLRVLQLLTSNPHY
jgi:hypothetical protein